MKDFAKGCGIAILFAMFGHYVLRFAMVVYFFNAIYYTFSGEQFLVHSGSSSLYESGGWEAFGLCTFAWIIAEIFCGFFRRSFGLNK